MAFVGGWSGRVGHGRPTLAQHQTCQLRQPGPKYAEAEPLDCLRPGSSNARRQILRQAQAMRGSSLVPAARSSASLMPARPHSRSMSFRTDAGFTRITATLLLAMELRGLHALLGTCQRALGACTGCIQGGLARQPLPDRRCPGAQILRRAQDLRPSASAEPVVRESAFGTRLA